MCQESTPLSSRNALLLSVADGRNIEHRNAQLDAHLPSSLARVAVHPSQNSQLAIAPNHTNENDVLVRRTWKSEWPPRRNDSKQQLEGETGTRARPSTRQQHNTFRLVAYLRATLPRHLATRKIIYSSNVVEAGRLSRRARSIV